MEPTSEVISFHSMKSGGVWFSVCILILRYLHGIQISDSGCIVKDALGFKPAEIMVDMYPGIAKGFWKNKENCICTIVWRKAIW